GDGNVSTEPNPTHTYTSLPEEGFFIVTLQVTDDGAPETGENPRTGIAQHQLQVVEAFDATLPWAIIVPSTPVSGVAPLAVELDASASYSPVGATITDYQWLFSDTSETTTGPTASHTFKNPGTWFVTLTVTDSAGRMGSESIPIYVAPSEPAPDALVFGRATAAPLEALPGSPIQFSSVGTFDPEGQPFEIVGWDFDGNPLTLESIEPNPTWSFDTIGLHSVTLVAHEILPLPDPSRDIRVPLLVRISTDVGPPNSNPVGLISADTLILDAAGTINFTALVADVEDAADRLEVEWDLGGLGTATGLEASQEFTDPGTYDVTTTIRDRDGGTTTHSIKVAVLPLERPAGPMIDIGLPDGMLVFTTGDTLNLDLSNTRDPEGENVMVSTDWGDGTTPDEGTTIGHQ
ncbi:MAG TPA: PKD domain-containing protein, partial [bacterium]|nr:PKD domain-containing protein [bacterium]